ncbi:MAG: MFS transporter [Planctomycetota bacterium]|nr:MAG: MFS transporter [Planctomycetota bacterium]
MSAATCAPSPAHPSPQRYALRRWLVLLAGCAIQTTLGGVYAWSTFVPYLHREHGLSNGQSGLIFGVTFLTFTLTMVGAGWVLQRYGPRLTAAIAAVLFLSGYVLASFSGGSFAILFFGIAVVTGAGIGFGYVVPLTVCMKWFPERKGLISGVVVAGFGAGAILLSTIAEWALSNGVPILTLFMWLGLICGAIVFLAALVLSNPPDAGTRPAGQPQHLMRALWSWPFQVTVVGIFCGTFAGLLIIGNLTPLVMEAGLSEAQAAIGVAAFAVGNGLGRIVWGRLFDLITYRCIPLSLLLLGVASAPLLVVSDSMAIYVTVVAVAFFFGANFVLYASALSRHFGTDAFPRLYPLCFLAYGVAGLIAPGLGGFIADLTGSFFVPVVMCMVVLALGTIVTAVKISCFSPAVAGHQLANRLSGRLVPSTS